MLIYLITKLNFNEKSTYDSLLDTLKCLVMFCNTFNKTKLVIPKIASGLGRLNWETSFNILKYVFYDIRININISIFTLVKRDIELNGTH